MSEMTLQQAIGEAGKWGHLMRSLATITEVLKAVEMADQHLKETAARVVQQKAEAEKIVAANEKLKAQGDDYLARAKATFADAEGKAAKALAYAEAEGANIRKEATEAATKAKKLASDAKIKADDYDEKAKVLQRQLVELDGKLKAAQDSARKLLGG